MAADTTARLGSTGQVTSSRRFSVWSILALLLSAMAACPIFSVLGILFGLRALAEIKANPELRGRVLAFTAIILGMVIIVGWIVGGYYWNRFARTPMLAGPVSELRAGLSGDVATFQSGFRKTGSNLKGAEARQFLDEINRRYGPLSGGEQDALAKGAMPVGGQGRIPYILHFRNGEVRAEALFITFGGSVFRPVFSWGWVRIIDPEHGDLVYPLAERESANASQPASTQP